VSSELWGPIIQLNQKAEADGEDKEKINEESIIYRWHERRGRLCYDSASCPATTTL